MSGLPLPGPDPARYPDLSGKTILVSGGSTGIGRAAAELFRAQGSTVVNLDISAPENAEFETIICDVSDERAVADAVRQVDTRYQGIDVIFANAGMTWGKTVTETSATELHRVLSVNLFGVYSLARSGFIAMRDRGLAGSVVLTSSPHAWRTTADMSAYSISKAGILALCNALAIEGGEHGIRVNALLPGAVDTPILRSEAKQTGDEEAAMVRWGQVRPAGRVGQAQEIGAAAVFLASEAASFMTGAHLVVDGGMGAFLGGSMSVTSGGDS